MSSVAWQRRLRLPVSAVLALLSGVLLAPATARASCGDYVMLGAQGHGSSTFPSRAHGPSPLPAPCSGPTCSRQSIPIAPPPAPAPAPVEEERWAFPLLFSFIT